MWNGASARKCQENAAKCWALSDTGKGKFFLLLAFLQECELVFCSQNKQAKDEDVYHMQPHKEGGYLRQNKWLWHGPGSARPTLAINYKDSLASSGSRSLSLYEFGCGKISPNGRPK